MISFFSGISFSIKYPNIYTNTKYNKLIKLVATTQSVVYIVNAKIIETIPILLAVNNNPEYFLVNNLNCQNSRLDIIIINDNTIIMIDSTKYIVCGLNFVSKCKIKNSCVDFMVEDNNTINEYLLIFRFLKSIDGIITINDASNAIKKVIKLALSVVINIKAIITGKI
jgi:hypothetical protein